MDIGDGRRCTKLNCNASIMLATDSDGNDEEKLMAVSFTCWLLRIRYLSE